MYLIQLHTACNLTTQYNAITCVSDCIRLCHSEIHGQFYGWKLPICQFQNVKAVVGMTKLQIRYCALKFF